MCLRPQIHVLGQITALLCSFCPGRFCEVKQPPGSMRRGRSGFQSDVTWESAHVLMGLAGCSLGCVLPPAPWGQFAWLFVPFLVKVLHPSSQSSCCDFRWLLIPRKWHSPSLLGGAPQPGGMCVRWLQGKGISDKDLGRAVQQSVSGKEILLVLCRPPLLGAPQPLALLCSNAGCCALCSLVFLVF